MAVGSEEQRHNDEGYSSLSFSKRACLTRKRRIYQGRTKLIGMRNCTTLTSQQHSSTPPRHIITGRSGLLTSVPVPEMGLGKLRPLDSPLGFFSPPVIPRLDFILPMIPALQQVFLLPFPIFVPESSPPGSVSGCPRVSIVRRVLSWGGWQKVQPQNTRTRVGLD